MGWLPGDWDMQSNGHTKDPAVRAMHPSTLGAGICAANAHHRPGRRTFVLKKDRFDLTKFIRSMQRAEGGPDCFGRAQGHCDQLNCVWRRYCVDKPQDEATSRKDEQGQVHYDKAGSKKRFPGEQ